MMDEVTLQELLILLEDDRPILELLLEEGILRAPLERTYTRKEAEEARVARVLLREMEVNCAGVEIILHMRQQIIDLQRQMTDVLEQIRASRV